MTFEYLPHTADIKVAIAAADLHELFADATEIARQLLVGSSPVAASETRTIEIRASDTAEVLLEYLRELLYQFDADRFVAGEVELGRATPTSLKATVRGERFDPLRHETQPEVKAVTRHELVAERTEGGWRAEVLFDV